MAHMVSFLLPVLLCIAIYFVPSVNKMLKPELQHDHHKNLVRGILLALCMFLQEVADLVNLKNATGLYGARTERVVNKFRQLMLHPDFHRYVKTVLGTIQYVCGNIALHGFLDDILAFGAVHFMGTRNTERPFDHMMV